MSASYPTPLEPPKRNPLQVAVLSAIVTAFISAAAGAGYYSAPECICPPVSPAPTEAQQ